MANRTYRYFSGDSLFPFGYGLSYATFRYSNPRVSREIRPGGRLRDHLSGRDKPQCDGWRRSSAVIPDARGGGRGCAAGASRFQRIHLAHGQTMAVTFKIRDVISALWKLTGSAHRERHGQGVDW